MKVKFNCDIDDSLFSVTKFTREIPDVKVPKQIANIEEGGEERSIGEAGGDRRVGGKQCMCSVGLTLHRKKEGEAEKKVL